MPIYKSYSLNQKRQQGAVLIAALMILTAMTLLGFSSLSNTSVQSAITRNTQFLMYARNVAQTEINGQLGIINNNAASASDPIIQTLLDRGLGNEYPIPNISATQTAFTQSASMTVTCEQECTASGFSYGATGLSQMEVSLVSAATLSNTQATSQQTQGFWYLIPAN